MYPPAPVTAAENAEIVDIQLAGWPVRALGVPQGGHPTLTRATPAWEHSQASLRDLRNWERRSGREGSGGGGSDGR